MNSILRNAEKISPALRDVLRGASYFFLIFGTLALGYAAFVFADSNAYQAFESKKLAQAALLSEPHILVEGEVIGELQVPRLGLDVIVVQGDSPASLRRAVGHLANSALPGEPGNVALAGHRDTFFRPLRDIQPGDEIRFKARQRSFDYRVESIEIVGPTDLHVLESSAAHQLTLLTCFPFYYVGPAPKRFIVRAREVDGTLQKQLARKNEIKTSGAPSRFIGTSAQASHPEYHPVPPGLSTIPALRKSLNVCSSEQTCSPRSGYDEVSMRSGK
jgi:sortase A